MKTIIKSSRLLPVSFNIVLILLFMISFLNAQSPIQRAGLRSSAYGISPFPTTEWWKNVTLDMSNRFTQSSPALVWILGYTTNNGCYLNFPKPNDGKSYPYIYFGKSDGNESYLNYFDQAGVKVWLQIEPGNADIITLIELVLNKYSHHPCIIGFGIDVEWYKTGSQYPEGKAVTDDEARLWVTKIKSYNSNYLLFTKHWLTNKMPPAYRDGIVFISDSQQFNSLKDMTDEFEVWAKTFAPAKVGFQYGYPDDKKWWGTLPNPPKTIGEEICKKCPNTSDLIWVDFTAYDIWDRNFTEIEENSDIPKTFELNNNYPNPFNPSTNISFNLSHYSFVKISILNILGQEVDTLLADYRNMGNHTLTWNPENQASGTYICRMNVDGKVKITKMQLIK